MKGKPQCRRSRRAEKKSPPPPPPSSSRSSYVEEIGSSLLSLRFYFPLLSSDGNPPFGIFRIGIFSRSRGKFYSISWKLLTILGRNGRRERRFVIVIKREEEEEE